MTRKTTNWGWVARRNPDSLIKRVDSMPEHLRDMPLKRKRLVESLIDEHGGAARITVKEALLIDRIGRLWPYLELMDRAAFDAGNPEMRPVDYTAMNNSLVRAVQALSKIAEEKRTGGETIDIARYLSGKTSVRGTDGRKNAPKNQTVTESDVHLVSEKVEP